MADQIKARKITLKEIFKEYAFIIPSYQRSYVWDKDNIIALLEDIDNYFREDNDNKEYFIGSFVFIDKGDNNLEVVDGQQRLTTLLLVLAVIRDLTKDVDMGKYIHNEYIEIQADVIANKGKKQRISFEIRDEVRKFLEEFVYICYENYNINTINNKYNKKEQKSDYNTSKNISLKNMFNALITIKEYFTQKNYVENDDNKKIKNFLNNLLSNVVVVYVSASNIDDAFRFFTVLNNRGVPLLVSDILKAINLGAIENDSIKNKCADKWEEIEIYLGDDFVSFLRYIRDIIIKKPIKESLLKEYENIIYKNKMLTEGEKTINYLENYFQYYKNIICLEEYDETYSYIGLPLEYKNLINILEYFQTDEWKPALLFFYEKFGKNKLYDFLIKMEEKMLCDVIVGLRPSERSQNFYKIIDKIDNSESEDDVLESNELKNDNKTQAVKIIKEENIFGRRFVKYLLLRYEYMCSEKTHQKSDYNTLSIEHILPQHPNDNSKWKEDFSDDELLKWTDNIANLVLISGKRNSSLSNLDFDEKKEKLKNRTSDFIGTNNAFKEDEWTPRTLCIRNKNIIKIHFGENFD